MKFVSKLFLANRRSVGSTRVFLTEFVAAPILNAADSLRVGAIGALEFVRRTVSCRNGEVFRRVLSFCS